MKGNFRRQENGAGATPNLDDKNNATGSETAIIGISCRFPGARDYHAFWDNLKNGVNAIREIPAERWDPGLYYSPDFDAPNKSISKWCGLVDGIEKFDNRFFNISPREARNMDPQQRILLEETWKCIEDSGLSPRQLRDETTAVYVGVMGRDYLQEISNPSSITDSYTALGNYDCILANRVSYFLGLRGPSLSIDAACASSLVALHKARRTLESNEGDFALAAGVSLNLFPWKYISFSKSRMLSPDGQCRTFDRDANGYVPGDGIGVVLLCTLEKAQELGCHIYGVVKGSSINHVGSGHSITAPRVEAQSEVIRNAYEDAKLDSSTISYVEAHGTGTSLGDPIEIEALSRVFEAGGPRKSPCMVGSVKTNIGHLEASAGVAGVIKVLLMMKHRYIPKHLNLKNINPMIDFEETPFRVAQNGGPWEVEQGQPLRAGVSSFGFGGVNSHVLLEAYDRPIAAPDLEKPHVFMLSAKTPGALELLVKSWQRFVQHEALERMNLTNLAGTLVMGRSYHSYRFAFCFEDHASLANGIRENIVGSVLKASSWMVCFDKPGWAGFAPFRNLMSVQAGSRFKAYVDEIKAVLTGSLLGQKALKSLLRDKWPQKYRGLFGFVMQWALFQTLKEFGFSPGMITSRGQGLPAALVCAGLVDVGEMCAALLGDRKAPLSLGRPLTTFVDPVSGDSWKPYLFDEAYAKRLRQEMVVDDDAYAYYCEKATHLRQNQYTFKKLLSQWDEQLASIETTVSHLLADFTMKLHRNSPAEKILLVIIIKSCLLEVNRKWDLKLRKRIHNQSVQEVIAFLLDEVLPPEVLVEWILSSSPNFARIVSLLTLNQDRIGLHTGETRAAAGNADLVEIDNVASWFSQASQIEQNTAGSGAYVLQLCGNKSNVELGQGVVGDLSENAPGDLLTLLKDLWVHGVDIQWQSIYPQGSFQRVPLPGYAFEHKSFWLNKQTSSSASSTSELLESKSIEVVDESVVIPEKFCSATRWVPYSAPLPDVHHRAGATLWFGDRADLDMASDAFPLERPDMYVRLGARNRRYSDKIREMHLEAPGFDKLLGSVEQLRRIVVFCPRSTASLSATDLPALEKRGALFWLRLLKALIAWQPTAPVEIVCVTQSSTQTFGVSHAHHAYVSGLLRSLHREQPLLRGGVVDLQLSEIRGELNQGILLGSLAGLALEGRDVAYWNRVVYQRQLLPFDLPEPEADLLQKRGHYVVMGGFGGVGYELCQYLAKRYQAQITLVGRSVLASTRVEKLHGLTALGGEAHYLQADLCVLDEVEAVLAKAHQRFGSIRGVFHTAMVYNETPIARMQEANYLTMLSPKVYGAVHLGEALQPYEPDFLMFFSSAQSFAGNEGRAHYGASCTFADAHAAYLDQILPFSVKTINWGFWDVGAMDTSQIQDELKKQGIRTIEPAVGMEVVRRLLGSRVQQVMALDLDDQMLKLMGVTETSLHQLPGSSIHASVALAAEQNVEWQDFLAAYGALADFGNHSLYSTLTRLGLDASQGDWDHESLASTLGIAPHHQRLFGWLVPQLSVWLAKQDGTPKPVVDLDEMAAALVEQHPLAKPFMPLLLASCKHLQALLCGQVRATDILFPEGSMSLVEGFYRQNIMADTCNDLVIKSVVAYIQQHLPGLKAGEKLRILEVGAGTGGTSAGVLAAICEFASQVRYTYTDLSHAFLRHGRRHFGETYPFMEFQIFDLEKDVRLQDIEPGSFDVVIATNVLHATRSMQTTLNTVKTVLKTGGWLVANELTEVSDYTTLTFGLLSGWWLFEDESQRLPGGPLLDLGMWHNLLGSLGFSRVISSGDGACDLPQNVIMAESDGMIVLPTQVAETVETPAAVPEVVVVEPTSVLSFDTGEAWAPDLSHAALEFLQNHLLAVIGDVLDLSGDELAVDAPYAEFGVDSLASVEIIQKINQVLGIELRATDLYNYANVEKLSTYVLEKHRKVIEVLLLPPEAHENAAVPLNSADSESDPSVTHISDSGPEAMADVAVIGMSGRFPGAADVGAFWDNLVTGTDCVVEVPSERWPLEGFYDPDQDMPNRSYAKWGGFLEGVDQFDPLFFHLSPKEAERMDPQQRLILQEGWRAFEEAGYGKDELAGSRCGVFVGVEDSDYKWWEDAYDAHSHSGHSVAMLAARLSYFLDLKGPCLSINTACSSSLVATHQACEVLRTKQADMCLVGGVALLATPRLFLSLSKAGMFSPTGRCRTFDAEADGFIPGEAACAVVLKSLSQALADGDHIHGVIKGSGVNQDGKTNGITAPSASSQTALEKEVYERFGIDPQTISYVEAHGTGTRLGDPIEVHALTDAFVSMGVQGRSCAIGSVKSNVGHTLAASGLVGMIKVLLCMKHQTLVPSLHFQQENSHIRFDQSPFVVNDRLRPWQTSQVSLRATVSAFGFSGTNAHVVLEEAPYLTRSLPSALPAYLIVLSAQSSSSLSAQVSELTGFLRRNPSIELRDVAYTLMRGRGHFPYRLAMVVDSIEDLLDQLARVDVPRATADQEHQAMLQELGRSLMQELRSLQRPTGIVWVEKLRALAELYHKGYKLPWHQLYGKEDGRRISLPTYRFDTQSYWLAPKAGVTQANSKAGRHTRSLSEDHFLLRDHVMAGRRILPGVCILDMALAAARSNGRRANGVAGVTWEKPFLPADGTLDLLLKFHPENPDAFEAGISGSEQIVCATGKLISHQSDAPFLDLDGLRQRCSKTLDSYTLLDAQGYHYGDTFQALEWVSVGDGEAFAKLTLPGATPTGDYALHPVIADGILQVATVLICGAEGSSAGYLPLSLGQLRLFGSLPSRGFVHVQRTDQSRGRVAHFQISFADASGRVAVTFVDYCLKQAASEQRVLHLAPTWVPASVPSVSAVGTVMVLSSDTACVERLGQRVGTLIWVKPGSAYRRVDQRTFDVRPGSSEDFQRLCQDLAATNLLPQYVWGMWQDEAGTDLQKQLDRGIYTLTSLTKELVKQRVQACHIRWFYTEDLPANHALISFARTLRTEHPSFTCRIVQFESVRDDLVMAECCSDGLVAVRYQHGSRLQPDFEVLPNVSDSVPAISGHWLISGGMGGLGQIFARYLLSFGASVVLCGRRPLNIDGKRVLDQLGSSAHYIQADISLREGATHAVRAAFQKFGSIHGVIHSAGVTEDRFILQKEPHEMARVFAPKIAGLVHLDEATRNQPLQWFVGFSSTAVILGNQGQSDYAYANGFMDHYLRVRQGPGRSLSINWGLWASGGLNVDAASRAELAQQYGMHPLVEIDGVSAFAQALNGGILNRAIVYANQKLLVHALSSPQSATQSLATESASVGGVLVKARTELVALFAQELGLAPERIRTADPLEHYGIDSVMVLALNRRLEKRFGALSKTLLFEYLSIDELAEWFAQNKSELFVDAVEASPAEPALKNSEPVPMVSAQPAQPIPQSSDERVAVIGLAGRYPMAPDLDTFWQNLAEGRDCIQEIPQERWDWQRYFNSDKNQAGKSYSKWGGFLENVDQFDAALFNISPREAETIDPQERIFLETCWQTLEDAGYTQTSLGRDVGVFVGIMYGEYQILGAQSMEQGEITAGSSYASVANRVSYFFDFHGPSLALDSMCSSSITAIHLASSAIHRGDCSVALAGGVNLSLHPNKYVMLSQGRFAAPDGRCKSFGAGGEGYVPGEGVGAVLLKPLQAALVDGDHIYGVIRGSSVNHGGKTNGYTVPNPVAQGDLIGKALERAGIRAQDLTYIEAHGTGTSLGDPIEISGLKRAFGHTVLGSCPIGSVKSNVGHLEAAAGISGLTKVLLQMKHGLLAPSIHSDTLNPHIDFSQTPFYVQRQLIEWVEPRRAGISSFGAGGSNGHLIVEAHPQRAANHETGAQVFVLSARTEPQLRRYVQQFLDFLVGSELQKVPKDTLETVFAEVAADVLCVPAEEVDLDVALPQLGFDAASFVGFLDNVGTRLGRELPFLGFDFDATLSQILDDLALINAAPASEHSLVDMAYTLQVGRVPMAHRLAIVTTDVPSLVHKLATVLDEPGSDCYQSHAKIGDSRIPADPKVQQRLVQRLVAAGAWGELGDLWTKGLDVDWQDVTHQRLDLKQLMAQPHRRPLPTYPFEPKSYWLPQVQPVQASPVSVEAPVSKPQDVHNVDVGKTVMLTPFWEEQPAPQPIPVGPVLLFDLDNEWFEFLSEQCSAVLVKPGSGFQVNGNVVALNPAEEADYQRLFEWLEKQAFVPRQIIHHWCKGTDDPSTIDDSLIRGFYAVLYITRQLMNQSSAKTVPALITVYEDGNGKGQPQYASLAAMAEAIAAEKSTLLWTTVGLIGPQMALSQLLPKLLAEGQSGTREVRYIQGRRMVWSLRETQTHPTTLNGMCWLISGGLGGLGFLVACELARIAGTKLVLTGRSQPGERSEQQLAQLRSLGARAIYLPADVSREADCLRLVQAAKAEFGSVDGVIHSAGVVRDKLLTGKSQEDIEAVFSPKIMGTLNLDLTTRQEPLKYFVCFSSLSSVLGNAGQVDYAFSNGFMDAYMARRAASGPGKSLSISWPLWREGGMQVGPAGEKLLLQTKGLIPMGTEVGMDALLRCFNSRGSHVVVAHGRPDKLLNGLGVTQERGSRRVELRRQKQEDKVLIEQLQELVGRTLKMGPKDVDPREDLGTFGFESVTLTEFALAMNEQFGLSLTPAHLYDYTTLVSLSEYLTAEHGVGNAQVADAAVSTQTILKPIEWTKPLAEASEKIAVVGMAGQMPGSDCLEQFWENLVAAKDLVGEVPSDRWDWQAFYGDPFGEGEKTNSKWGGFIPDAFGFDAAHFGIAPREALLMDPQQRLFLECTWNALEDAGIAPSSLAGSNTGIFVGCSGADFSDVLMEHEIEAHTGTGSHRAILPNRISYLLDFHGPSEPIDTACSSSLLAIHRAVASIKSGECSLAIAGGVQVILSPRPFVMAAKAGMLSPNGRCKTFDASADGYVKSEGVGALVLMPSEKAVAEGFNVLAYVRGSSVNHGGRARSLTVPNPKSQADLLVSAFERAGVAPEQISYLEAHGTGTSLGDPIEINGIKKAFVQYYQSRGQRIPATARCGVGTVKSNVGHLEGAAGIAGVLKILLAMKHGQIPASIHVQSQNPYIEVEDSPLYIVREAEKWDTSARFAGVSSFGFGGVNVHMVFEAAPTLPATSTFTRDHLVLLSACDTERLGQYASKLLHWLNGPGKKVSLADIAFTSQVGRDAMADRLAILADSKESLGSALQAFLDGREEPSFVRGNVASVDPKQKILLSGGVGERFLQDLLREGELEKLAHIWTSGLRDIQWHALYGGNTVRQRLSMPTYPFKKKTFRLGSSKVEKPLPPLAQRNILEPLAVGEGLFELSLKEGTFLDDHVVGGQVVLPGVAILEIVRAAAASFSGLAVHTFEELVWMAPLRGQRTVQVQLIEVGQHLAFEISSRKQGGQLQRHAEGRVLLVSSESLGQIDIEGLRQRSERVAGKEQIYRDFTKMGIAYGPSFQSLQEVFTGNHEVLGRLEIPSNLPSDGNIYPLHPVLVDGMLHAGIALRGESELEENVTLVPFSLKAAKLSGSLPKKGWVHMRRVGVNQPYASDVRVFDLNLCDEQGRVRLLLQGLSTRVIDSKPSKKDETQELHYFQSGWIAQSLNASQGFEGNLLIISEDEKQFKAVERQVQGKCIHVIPASSFDRSSGHYRLDISAEAQCQQLVTDLMNRISISGLLWFMDEDAEKNVLGYHNLCSLLYKHTSVQHLRTGIVSPVGSATAATVAAYARTMVAEHSRHGFVCIEADRPIAPKTLVSELAHSEGAHARYLSGERYLWRLLPLDSPSAKPFSLKRGSVCLITGGAGGLGLMLAKHLYKRYGARLVLTGRTAQSDCSLPAGCEFKYLVADVSDESSMKKVVKKTRAHFGSVDAVFHCAGVVKDSLFFNKKASELLQVFSPKIRGIQVLDKVTAREPLQLFVAFSSAAAVFGNVGQADYAAANAYMDWFLEQRALSSKPGRSLSVNWPLWRDGGMHTTAQRKQELRELGIGLIDHDMGMEALDGALQAGLSCVVPLVGQWDKLREFFRVVDELPQEIVKVEPESSGLITWLKEKVATALGTEVMGIDADRTFSDYGVDSFIIIRIFKALENRFGELPKTLLFEKDSITQLAIFLDNEFPERPEASSSVSQKDPDVSQGTELEVYLLKVVADALGTNIGEIKTAQPFAEYGVDSFITIRIIKELENRYGELPKTLLFEQDSIVQLIDYLRSYQEVEPLIAENQNTDLDSAIDHGLAHYLVQVVAEALGTEMDEIKVTQPFAEYGVDSFITIRIIKELENRFGDLPKTLLFEQDSIERLASCLCNNDGETNEDKFDSPIPELASSEGQDLEQYLKQVVAEALGSDAGEIENSKPFAEYGVDSFITIRIIKELEKRFGELPKTLLFEQDSIEQLVACLGNGAREAVEDTSKALAPESVTEPDHELAQYLAQVVSDALGAMVGDIKADQPFSEYGVDSFITIRIIKELEMRFGELPKTLLFEQDSIAALSAYLLLEKGAV